MWKYVSRRSLTSTLRMVVFGTTVTLLAVAACAVYAQADTGDSSNATGWQTQKIDLDVAGRTTAAISGNWAIVGRAYVPEAYVLEYSNDEWIASGTISPNNGRQEDRFGWSVAMDGDIAVVGAPGRNTGTGEAYLFVLQNDSTWKQAATLQASDGTIEDRFGEAVAISGNTIVVGAPCDLGCVTESGGNAVYVFVKPPGGWGGALTETTKLVGDGGSSRDQFGYAVSISGNTVVVGARYAPANQTAVGSGVAEVFVSPSAGWASQQQITPSASLVEPDPERGDAFGTSVAIHNDTVAVGAPLADSGFGNTADGRVYIYLAPASGWSGEIAPSAALASGAMPGTGSVGVWVATTGVEVLTGSVGAYLFKKPRGEWGGNLLPTVDFVDSQADSGALWHSTMMTEDPFGAYFTMPFNLSMTISAPTAVTVGQKFESEVYLTNNSATTTLPVRVRMYKPTRVDIVNAFSTSGVCTSNPDVECSLSPISGNGGEASVSIKMRSGSNFRPIDDSPIKQEVSIQGTTPVLRVEGSTQVSASPLVVGGFHPLTITAGHTGTESFSVNTAAGAEPIYVSVGSSTNPELLPVRNVLGASSCVTSGNCVLTIEPIAGKTGHASVTVSVSDEYGRFEWGRFDVTVTAASQSGGGGAMWLGLPFLFLLFSFKLINGRRRSHWLHIR